MWNLDICGSGDAMMYGNERHPLVSLEWCLHVEMEGGTGGTSAGEGRESHMEEGASILVEMDA